MNSRAAKVTPMAAVSEARALAFLADLSETLAVSLDLRQTLSEAVNRIADFMDAEAASLFLNGEPATARVILRDLVNATVGFEGLAKATERPSKSLHRMLSANGNPSMDNLAAIFDVLRRNLQVNIEVRAA